MPAIHRGNRQEINGGTNMHLNTVRSRSILVFAILGTLLVAVLIFAALTNPLLLILPAVVLIGSILPFLSRWVENWVEAPGKK